MRISIILLFGVLIQISAAGWAQKVSVRQGQTTYKELFKEVEQQTGLITILSNDEMDINSVIKMEQGTFELEELYQKVLRDADMQFRLVDGYIVIKPAEKTIAEIEMPQQQDEKKITITGTVNDEKGEPLPFAAVCFKGTTTGCISAVDGTFTLQAPDEKGLVLEISSLGFVTQEIPVNGRSRIDVVLVSDIKGLDEVVVVGYGSVVKKDLTGTVATVKSDEIAQIKTQTIDQALAGQMTGVFVTASGGAPGSGSVVHIRGLSGIKGDNQPLYVVDGVPIIQNPNFGTLGLGTYGTRSNPLLSVNPNDIERVDVLKDASAAAIYGSRAANGVILITTKRGKQNQAPKFNFSVSSTIQNPTNTYNYLSADEWIPLVKDAAQATLNKYPEMYWPYFPTEYAIVNDPDYFGDANTDWQKEIVNKNALWNEYNFNVSGGSGNTNYYVSVTASDQEGLFKGSEFDRYSISSSLDAGITPWFKVGTSINYNYSVNKSSGLSSLQNGNFRPDLPVYDENGEFSGAESSVGYMLNPLGDLARCTNRTISKNMYGSVYGELQIVNDLKFRSRLNLNLNDSKYEGFCPSYSSQALFAKAYYSEDGARLSSQLNAGYSISFENTLNYNKLINNVHKFDALLGIAWDQSRLDLEAQTYLGFPDDVYLTNIQSANKVIDWSSESIENGLNSYFGRLNYVYDDRYLATFTARYDGSTKFGPDNKWGFFPSGALAWNMHNEGFLKENKTISQLKLRASLGRTGQDNLPSFSYLAYYQSLDNGDSFYNGVNGIAVSGVPNSGIKWETTDQLDLGIEFGLFNYRLSGEVVYFEKNTSDIILSSPIPAETGASSWQNNVADVSNKGWEITFGGDIIRRQNFRWNSSFNISFVKNKVESLKGVASSSSGIVEGYPIGVVVGYDVIKIAQTQEEIDALNQTSGGSYQSTLLEPGDYIFRDVSGPDGVPDGKITADDRTVLGDINPDYFGGWNNKLTYKNIDFSFNWQFVQGSEKNYGDINNLYYFDTFYNSLDFVNETWTEDFTNAPYARLGSGSHGYTPTSRSVVDASYIRLRSASIGYNLSQAWLVKLPISSARITLTGNNLITITDYPGLDPESVNSQRGGSTVDMTRDGGASYPNTRTFTIGLNVTF